MLTKKLFSQAFLLVSLSFLLGFLFNIQNIKAYFRGEIDPRFTDYNEASSIVIISLFEAQELFASGEALFIDSRPQNAYKEGHIMGAVSLPYEEAAGNLPLNPDSFPADKTLVVYCDGNECRSSENLALLFHDAGFPKIKVFFGGWEEWAGADLPIEWEDDTE